MRVTGLDVGSELSPSTGPAESGAAVGCVEELLCAAKRESFEAFADRVYDEYVLDTHLRREATGVEVQIGTSGILIDYPFTMDELWAVIDELHDEAEHALG